MKKFNFSVKPKDLRSLLFRIFIFIIAFSFFGFLISVMFPREAQTLTIADKAVAVDKLIYWKDKNGTVAVDIEYLNENDFNCKISKEYASYGLNPNIAKISNNAWNLLLLNKNNILPTNYELNLKTLTGTSIRLESAVKDAFNSMYLAASKQGLLLSAYCGYRNIESQRRMFENKLNSLEIEANIEYEHGGSYDSQGNYIEPVKKDIKDIAKEALKEVCPPGCSDHNAGLAVDIVSQSIDFEKTQEFTWLQKNAADFGFVLRYPKDKEKITGVNYQPYCWRFVGINAAKEMKEKNFCLEEYLSSYIK